MPRILHKIKDAAADLRKININFDSISLDIADARGLQSSRASFNGTVNAGTTAYAEIDINDSNNLFVRGKVPFIPRFDCFIDVDEDFTYQYPAGINISQATLHGCQVECFLSKTPINVSDNLEKGTLFFIIRNRDSSNHDFYVYVDGFYLPGPDLGVAARPAGSV